MIKRVLTGCFALMFGLAYGIAGPNPVDHHESHGVVLTQSASTGQRTIVVNDSTGIGDPTNAIRIQSADGATQETHYVYTFNGNTVTLNAPLANSFPANSTVTLRPGGAGAGAGPKHGVAAGPPGWLVSTEKSSKAPILAILIGAGIVVATVIDISD